MRALITGINGMVGSHMADLLLSKGYEVFGLERRSAAKHRSNTKHIENRITYISGDLTDQNSLIKALEESDADEVYNFGAQSFVMSSFLMPEMTLDVTGAGVLRLLEAVRKTGKQLKVYQAGSSEMFGKVQETPQTENTRFYPRSPYAVAKVYGHWISKNYREAYNMFNVNGICFNCESERRGHEFVTRKITDGVARIVTGKLDFIELGNINSERDWGYAPDYVEAIWAMLQQEKPDDYVIATGITHSVRDFLQEAFTQAGINNYEKYIRINKKFIRPTEVDLLVGDYSKARKLLNWEPKTSFKSIVSKMVSHDIKIHNEN